MVFTICGANKGASPSLIILENGEDNTGWNLVNTLTQPNLMCQEKWWVHKQCQTPGAGQTARPLFEAKEWCDRMFHCWTRGAAVKACEWGWSWPPAQPKSWWLLGPCQVMGHSCSLGDKLQSPLYSANLLSWWAYKAAIVKRQGFPGRTISI